MRKIFSLGFLMLVAGVGLYVPYVGLALLPMMITIIVMSYKKGRFFCGKVCPHGFLFDNVIYKMSMRRKAPKLFMSAILAGLYFIYFMSMFTKNIYVSANSDNFLYTLSFKLSNMYFIVTVVGVTLGVMFSSRTFCHFCPQGTLQKGVIKLSESTSKIEIEKVQLVDSSKCINCKLCNKSCPMQIAVIDEIVDGVLQNTNCIKCGKCCAACPKKILVIE